MSEGAITNRLATIEPWKCVVWHVKHPHTGEFVPMVTVDFHEAFRDELIERLRRMKDEQR